MEDENQDLLFDEQLNAVFRDTAHKAFLKVPELRSVVVIYDYYKDLNDASNINKGMWLHAEGSTEKPIDSVVGSIGATLQALAHMLDEQMRQHSNMTKELVELSQELVKKTTLASKGS